VNYRVTVAVTKIVDFHHHAEDYCGGMVICRHTEIWTFGFAIVTRAIVMAQ
jgi:hypothetical protein